MRFNKEKALRRIFNTELSIEMDTLIPCKRSCSNGRWRATKGKYRWFIKEGDTIIAKGEVWGKRDAEVEAYVKREEIKRTYSN